MNLKFESKSEKPWLAENNEKSRDRIYKLGRKAIDSLIEDGIPISYRNIALRSKQLDESGQGIHSNSIKNNKELYDYYQKHCKFKSKTNHSRKIKIGEIDYKHLKLDRNVQRVKGRYMRMSKQELVELLINAEQYIAEQNQVWIKTQFESFK